MSKKIKLRTLAKIMLADIANQDLAEIETDKGILFLVDAEMPEVGMEVFVLDGEDARVLPEDGTYLWEEKALVIEGGVIVSIDGDEPQEPERPDGGEDEKLRRGRRRKLSKLDSAETVTVEDHNAVVEAVNELIAAVADLGGEVPGQALEELRAHKRKLSALERSVKEVEGIVLQTTEALSAVSKRSNGRFAEPNPGGRHRADHKRRLSHKTVEEYFRKK